MPIARFYVERFLERNRDDIRGRVLEVGDRAYTIRFGGCHVSQSDVLHVEEGHPEASLVVDLTEEGSLESGVYDRVILTFVLNHIFDVGSALRTVHDSLRPGGVLLLAEHGTSSLSRYDYDRWGDFWRFTSLSLRQLLAEDFHQDRFDLEAHGNVLATTAFLHGLVVDEMRTDELTYHDPDFELVITARAVKSG